MPVVPEQPKMDTERIACRIELGIAASVRAYAEWRGWDRDWAINRLLEYALTCEKDFRTGQTGRKAPKKRRGVGESASSSAANGDQP